MTIISAMINTIFRREDLSRIPVEARVENAVFDLKKTTRANIATTKLLEETLQRSATN